MESGFANLPTSPTDTHAHVHMRACAYTCDGLHSLYKFKINLDGLGGWQT